MAASEALEKLLLLKKTLDLGYDTILSLAFFVDSKDLYHSLASKQNTMDTPVRANVNPIIFHLEASIDLFGWCISSVRSTDAETKLDSALVDILCLTLTADVMNNDLNALKAARGDSYLC